MNLEYQFPQSLVDLTTDIVNDEIVDQHKGHI